MGARPEPTRERAILRLITAVHEDRVLIVDALVAASDGADRWRDRGTPVTLELALPDSGWMATALAQLVVDWAAEDALVETTVVTTAGHAVARLGRDDSVVSLEVRPPGVDHPA